MEGFIILLGLFLVFLISLIIESLIYSKRIKRIPLRITVSGTRGKTSTVRMLASVYRSHGIRTLAKTTGSEAAYILPDGSEEKIRRKGLATILEQKKLIRKAIELDAACVITEIMSIHPENHRIESRKLIRPQVTLFTNFRADHTDVVGESIEEISELFVNDICTASTVIVPQTELRETFKAGIVKNRASLLTAVTGTNLELNPDQATRQKQMPVNLDLVVTAARLQGIPDETVAAGIRSARLDIGESANFQIHHPERKIWFVNAFAANDPLSTRQVMEKAMDMLADEFMGKPQICGLLSLRSDRGERSQQWLRFLLTDGKTLFDHLFVTGTHAPIFSRKLDHCDRLTSKDPEKILTQIIQSTAGDIVIFGIANIHGLGLRCLNSWSGKGSPP